MNDEKDYFVDKQVIERNQKEIKMRMRAILLDWMSEVCADFLFTRETYFSAVKFVDMFLMYHPNVKKSEFQLVGICALLLSMKITEINTIPSDKILCLANNIFSKDQMISLEMQMINNLGWRLNPMTLHHWAAYITSNWDTFAINNLKNHLTIDEDIVYLYRTKSVKNYMLYRELCQYLDACILVPENLNYNGGL